MNGFQFSNESPSDIHNLLQKANQIREMSPLESLRLNEEALHYAELGKDRKLWHLCLIDISKSHMRLGNYHQAHQYLEQASKYQLNAELHWLRGILYRTFGDLSQGLYHQFESLKMMEDEPNKRIEYGALSEIALIYHNQEEFGLELSTYQKILDSDLNTVKINEAATYNNIAMAQLALKKYKDAFDNARHAYKLGLELDNKSFVCNTLCSMGEILLEAKQASKALKYLNLSLKQSRDLGIKLIELFSIRFIGQAYLALNQSEKGLSHLELALTLARKFDEKLELSHCHRQLADAYKSLGDYQKALAHFEKYHQLYQEQLNAESVRSLQELRLLHESKSR